MKLIIEIDEEEYNLVKRQVLDGITNPLKICIANGTPLDDIRAEIEQIQGNEYEVSDMQGNRYKYETITKDEALKIIDKYMN